MDFIERLFGISPDGGSGATEMLLMLAPLVACVGAIFGRRIVRVLRRLFVP
jgi:hypothetical protein